MTLSRSPSVFTLLMVRVYEERAVCKADVHTAAQRGPYDTAGALPWEGFTPALKSGI